MGRRAGGELLTVLVWVCPPADTPHQCPGRALPPHEVLCPPQTWCWRERGRRPHSHLLRALLPPGCLPDRHVRHGHAEVSCPKPRYGGLGRGLGRPLGSSGAQDKEAETVFESWFCHCL